MREMTRAEFEAWLREAWRADVDSEPIPAWTPPDRSPRDDASAHRHDVLCALGDEVERVKEFGAVGVLFAFAVGGVLALSAAVGVWAMVIGAAAVAGGWHVIDRFAREVGR